MWRIEKLRKQPRGMDSGGGSKGKKKREEGKKREEEERRGEERWPVKSGQGL